MPSRVGTEHGSLPTPSDPNLLPVMEAEARVSERYKDALRELGRELCRRWIAGREEPPFSLRDASAQP